MQSVYVSSTGFRINIDYFPKIGTFVKDIYVFCDREMRLLIFVTRYSCFYGLINFPYNIKM